ncbi:hypothetical protein NAT51_19220 [Flavobacterium amniphilum]|uniref:DUF7336 domain-containing protein n=1 Tax=Flavobacterium amniphilum TaxID=1834035 RepID=UPI00202A2843|nr:hypothetical protein [Flavobacterium amniphilum]MCL9807662.1 hypothetical protein [Flavobacterium amniphilum]
MEKVFILEHIYDYLGTEEIKFIGIFSSIVKAEEAILFLKDLPGFNKYAADCFKISENKLDDFEWKTGFVGWDDAIV